MKGKVSNFKNKFRRILVVVMLVFSSFVQHRSSFAALSGSAAVTVSGDNAAAAKQSAIANARRIVWDSVLPGVTADASDIADMVETMSIADEKNSGTEYSANVTISFSEDLVRKWAAANEVELPIMNTNNLESQVLFSVSGLRQWASVNAALRVNGIKMNVESIDGHNIIANVPIAKRAAFVATLRASGAEVLY
ncbi:MAG: hypothetical protein LBR41_02350 [Rickettsiales bacterium]|jgi:hypothetical protein|nr:hypothetical protein [Rickettsiales bacterium]